MKQKHFIDSHKCSNAPVILALMAWFGAFHNVTAWVYLALHGTYGLLWVMKSRLFGDRQWERPTSLGMGLAIWGVLSLLSRYPEFAAYRSRTRLLVPYVF